MINCKIPIFLMEQTLLFDLSSSVRTLETKLHDSLPPVN